MGKKVFKTLDEQIAILQDKNLIIPDIQKAEQILLKENYFFLSGYRHLFMYKGDTKFITGTTFDELYAMFKFDRRLRNIFFKNILMVENNVKSLISYELSKKYGYQEKDYLNPKNFIQDRMKYRQVKDVLNKVKRQIRVNGRQHSATTHYMDNYGYIPLWILVKVLSFGIVSELYNILKDEDKTTIADNYNMKPYQLSTYLSVLANYRNLCAHEDILYDHRIQRPIGDTPYHEKLKIDKIDDEYAYGKNDLYAIVIILKYMMADSEFRDFIAEVSYEIDMLDGKTSTVPIESILNKIGFPDNWKDIVDITV